MNSRYLRQTVPHVAFFSLNSPILVLEAGGQRALTTRTDWEDSQTPEGTEGGMPTPRQPLTLGECPWEPGHFAGGRVRGPHYNQGRCLLPLALEGGRAWLP